MLWLKSRSPRDERPMGTPVTTFKPRSSTGGHNVESECSSAVPTKRDIVAKGLPLLLTIERGFVEASQWPPVGFSCEVRTGQLSLA